MERWYVLVWMEIYCKTKDGKAKQEGFNWSASQPSKNQTQGKPWYQVNSELSYENQIVSS